MRLAVLILLLASPARAGRYIATPLAETLAKGQLSLWQFGLYEERGPDKWRSLNRVDLGVWDGAELGLFVSSPENKPSDTWVNVQYRPLAEGKYVPAFSIGAWDAFRKGAWFEDFKAGPSPFAAASKTYKAGKRYARGGISYGFNRLHGLFGGLEARVHGGTGIIGEYVPKNSRLPGADRWNFGVYQWLGSSWRVRASWMGGNPMLDAFFTYSLGMKP